MTLRSLRPSRGLLGWVLVLAAGFGLVEGLLLAGVLTPDTRPLAQDGFRWLALLTLALALLDLPTVLSPPQVQVTRQVDQTLAVDRPATVVLRLTHTLPRTQRVPTLRLACHDHHPQPAHCEGLPASVRLGAGQRAEVPYRLQLLQRGDTAFTAVDLRHGGWLGCWEAVHQQALPTPVRVFPDFSRLGQQGQLNAEEWSRQAGIRKRPRRGEGLEFHQLREFRAGDSARQVDWKATVRRRQLISREYQEERDQHVLILLDAGQSMRALEGDLTHFDHALNSMMLLAHLALQSGDSVGCLTMGSEAGRYVAPGKGQDAIHHLLDAVYDLVPTTQPSDYLAAAMQLMRHNPRRSLVILLTNITDQVPDDLLTAVQLLRQRHVLLLANLREPTLPAILQAPVQDFDSALTYAMAADLAGRRQALAAELQRLGVRVFDTDAAGLTARLVNRYFDIKRAGVL